MATQTIIHVADLDGKTKDELIVLASDLGLENGTALTSLRREDVLQKVMQSCSDHHSLMAGGVLEIMNEGYGFLRQNIIRPGSGRRIYLPVADTAFLPAHRRRGVGAGSPAQGGRALLRLGKGGVRQ